jgi:hypothetical protein
MRRIATRNRQKLHLNKFRHGCVPRFTSGVRFRPGEILSGPCLILKRLLSTTLGEVCPKIDISVQAFIDITLRLKHSETPGPKRDEKFRLANLLIIGYL